MGIPTSGAPYAGRIQPVNDIKILATAGRLLITALAGLTLAVALLLRLLTLGLADLC